MASKAVSTKKVSKTATKKAPKAQKPPVVEELEHLLAVRKDKLIVLQAKFDDLKFGMEEVVNLDSQIFRQVAQATQTPK
jgi:hypothetical protein